MRAMALPYSIHLALHAMNAVRLPEGCDAEALEDADGVSLSSSAQQTMVQLPHVKSLPSKGSRVYKKAINCQRIHQTEWYSIENTALETRSFGDSVLHRCV